MSSTALTQKRRRSSWISSYSELSISDAEERLGFEMESLGKNPIAITELVATANNRVGGATINSMKEKVYSNILDYLGFEGYPSTLTKDFCEANVSDLVLLMLNQYSLILEAKQDAIYVCVGKKKLLQWMVSQVAKRNLLL